MCKCRVFLFYASPVPDTFGPTKYFFHECNPWLYNGSDVLWAQISNTLWGKVEHVHGKEAVRWHRASVELSDESPDDPIEVKRKKRKQALAKYQWNSSQAKLWLVIWPL